MRGILVALFLSLVIGNAASAQTGSDSVPAKKTISKPSRDHFMVQLSHDRWANVPDSIALKNSGRGVGVYLMYDFPIKESNFSFGAGLGLRFSNIYLDKKEVVLDGRTGAMVFQKDTLSKLNKYTQKFIEFPLELRYFANKENRNQGFKFAIGAKIGFTGIGSSFYKDRESIDGKFVNTKVISNRYNQKWRLTPTARIGWGNFSVFGEYTPTAIFNAGAGPDVKPFSVGIIISGL